MPQSVGSTCRQVGSLHGRRPTASGRVPAVRRRRAAFRDTRMPESPPARSARSPKIGGREAKGKVRGRRRRLAFGVIESGCTPPFTVLRLFGTGIKKIDSGVATTVRAAAFSMAEATLT